jgi:acetylornithine deacetylase
MSANSIPQDVAQLLVSMVQIPSVNPAACKDPLSESRLLAHNQSIARHMGFKTQHLPVKDKAGNLLITHRVNDSNDWLMFESHMDTVTEKGMTVDPFAGNIVDGKLYGRGSCDTKGTGAAMLWALHEYAQGDKQPNNIAIVFGMDEEYGMTGIRHFVKDHLPMLGMNLKGVIVGEPTLCRPIFTHNGCLRVVIQTRGKAAHSSTPNLGHSAISDMIRIICLLESEYIAKLSASHQLTGKAQASINLISGGTQINIIPDHCQIEMDRRMVPGENPQQVYRVINDLLSEHCPEIDWQLDCSFMAPPLPPNENGDLLLMVQQVLREVGINPKPLGVPYATDAGDLGSAGYPTIVLGPGDIAQAHTKDEWIALDQLQQGVEVYKQLMSHSV